MITRRLASTVSASGSNSAPRKVVLIGTGFLASYIARTLVADPRNRVLLVSRHPEKLHSKLSHLGSQILPPQSFDLTSSDLEPLRQALKDASAVVSMVGLLSADARQMVQVQEVGAKNVASISKECEVERIVMISAIGADRRGPTPYQRTKAIAEEAFMEASPTSTIIRPSIMFGPGDSFFGRFATLARFLPFLPVFGGGVVRFQPVYAGDVARAVEICCRDAPEVVSQVGGKIIEAGGPEVFTYRQIMQLVLQHTSLKGRRMIISLPYWVGMIQGWIFEKLPETIFTITRDQIRQLRNDNIVATSLTPPLHSLDFESLLKAFPSSLPSSAPPGEAGLTNVHKCLPTYLGPTSSCESGKRTHGTGSASGIEEVRNLNKKTCVGLKLKQGKTKHFVSTIENV